MPKVTKISLHCAETEQVEGSNLGEGIPGQVPTWEVSQGTCLTSIHIYSNPSVIRLIQITSMIRVIFRNVPPSTLIQIHLIQGSTFRTVLAMIGKFFASANFAIVYM